jgi:hypothetical protein
VGFVETGVSWRDGKTFILMEIRRDQLTPLRRTEVAAAV